MKAALRLGALLACISAVDAFLAPSLAAIPHLRSASLARKPAGVLSLRADLSDKDAGVLAGISAVTIPVMVGTRLLLQCHLCRWMVYESFQALLCLCRAAWQCTHSLLHIFEMTGRKSRAPPCAAPDGQAPAKRCTDAPPRLWQLWSEWTLKSTGCGLPAGAIPSLAASTFLSGVSTQAPKSLARFYPKA